MWMFVLAYKSTWHLLIDEAPQVDRCATHRLPFTHPVITDHIRLTQHDAVYSEIRVADREYLSEKARNREDDEVFALLGPTLRTLSSPHWRSFVNTEQYIRFLEGETENFDLHSILEPTILRGWESVFITAANFQDTIAAKLWSRRGVKFVEDPASRLRGGERGAQMQPTDVPAAIIDERVPGSCNA